MIPTCSYPAAFALGDEGWAVEVLQINLNAWREIEKLDPIAENGVFQGVVDRAVRTVQRRRGLYVDGIAGPRTQKRLALDLMTLACREAGLDRCVMRGLVDLETSYLVAAVNCSSPGGKDCFWTQWRITDGASSSTYREAAHGPTAFKRAADKIVQRTKQYGNQDYAILAHNWPAAAERYAAGTINEWVYTSREKKYRMDDPAPWIVEKDIDGVATGYDWANFYVSRIKRFCG